MIKGFLVLIQNLLHTLVLVLTPEVLIKIEILITILYGRPSDIGT